MLAGGRISSGAIPSLSRLAAALESSRFHIRSTAMAGNGSCPASTCRTASRTGAISALSSVACG
jgi:hypothetical protein